ncbi:MAG TPA: RNA polymerase sigma factor [Actinomycetota bacterium]
MSDHLSLVPEPDERATEPETQTFEEWMRTHARPLRRMCARLLRDEALAEDIVQETLLRAWTRREQFARDAQMGPWLRCVARNLCIEHLRTRGRMVPASDALPDHADVDADPTAPLERAEEHRFVREALSTLSDRHRALLVARDIEGVDYTELARREGVNEDAARAVLFRARRILREKYLAASRAVGAAVLWVRVRSRGGAGRAVAPAMTAAGASLASAVAAAVALVAASVSGVAGLDAAAPAAPASYAFAEAGAGGVEASAAPVATSSRTSTSLIRTDRASVTASVDPRGTTAARATARNPVTGDDEHVWTRIWREQGGSEDGSVVLGAADDAADAACADAPDTCEAADEALKDPGGILP